MRFFHISDLHLGKNVNGLSMIDQKDQVHWVERFLELSKEVAPDAVVIAGDVYDRSSPSGEAVMLLDQLLTGLSEMGIPVLLIAGNHDSGERLSFGKDLLSKSDVHVSGTLNKELVSVLVRGKDGDEVTFWLMPYIFPSLVSDVLEDESIRDYDTAVRRLLEEQRIDYSKRNVLVAHQNVTAGGQEVARGGSESMVGGVGQIDYTAFDGFTYVALGHIHSSYPVGRPEVRYAGTPLCYHFDELRQQEKGPLLVEISEDGAVTTEVQPIKPLHPMRRIEDSYDVVLEELDKNPGQGEYVRIVIKDRKMTPEISTYLRSLCQNRDSYLMELLSDYSEFSSVNGTVSKKDVEEKSVEELFVDFYGKRRNNEVPDEFEASILREAGEIMRLMGAPGVQKPDDKAIDQLVAFIMKQEV